MIGVVYKRNRGRGSFWTDPETEIVNKNYVAIGPEKTQQILTQLGYKRTIQAVIQRASVLRRTKNIKLATKQEFEDRLANLPIQSLFNVLIGFVVCLDDLANTTEDTETERLLRKDGNKLAIAIEHTRDRVIEKLSNADV